MKIRPVEPSCSMRREGRTDRHDEANKRLSQFCECTKKIPLQFSCSNALPLESFPKVLHYLQTFS